MALVSDVKSCLMWEFERPNVNSTVFSSYFRLFGEEWLLTLTITDNLAFSGNFGVVRLHSRYGKKITEMGALSSTCHVFTGTIAFGSSQLFSIRDLEQKILKFNISPQNYKDASPKWIIWCRIICAEPISLQINNETMLITNRASPEASDQSVQTCAEIPSDLQQLSDDFSRLLDKEIIPDATLTCGGQTWKVHRSVLTARSEVFAGMFRSGMAESETGSVRVEDLEPTVLDSLLKYVYSGKVRDVSDGNVTGLYEAADRFALLGLRKACSDLMAERLTRENCLGALVMADIHCDAQLKETVVSFVTEHFARIGKDVWTNFYKEHSLLAVEVLHRFAPSMEK